MKDFAGTLYDVQVYLEPGEAAITQLRNWSRRCLDVVRNEVDIAIVDASMKRICWIC